MRRILIPTALMVLVLSGLWLLARLDPPDEAGSWTRLESAIESPGLPGPGAVTEGGQPPPTAPTPSGFDCRLWTEGGVPVAALELRLETEDGRVVAGSRSDDDGRFSFAPAALDAAGSPYRIHINPGGANETFDTLRIRVPRERTHDEFYVSRIRYGKRIDVEIEIRNAVPAADGGGPVRVRLQDQEGSGLRKIYDPGETRVVIPRRSPGVYAISAVQGNRAAALPPLRLDPEDFPLLLVLERAAVVVGRVRTPDGLPAVGASVRLTYDAVPNRRIRGQYIYVVANSPNYHQELTATTDEEGVFRFEGLTPVRYDLSIRHASGSILEEVVVPAAGEVLELFDIDLAAGTGDVRIRLDFPDGLPAGAGELRVVAIGYRHRLRREVIVDDPRGSAIIAGLPPDSYGLVLVRARGLPGRRGRVEQFVSMFAKVEVKAGGIHEVTIDSGR